MEAHCLLGLSFFSAVRHAMFLDSGSNKTTKPIYGRQKNIVLLMELTFLLNAPRSINIAPLRR